MIFYQYYSIFVIEMAIIRGGMIMKTNVKVIIAIFIFIMLSVSIQRYAEKCKKAECELKVHEVQHEYADEI